MKRAVDLLGRLIREESLSRHEQASADLLSATLAETAPSAEIGRVANNVYAVAPGFSDSRPTLMLNSHHDTVPPSAGWTRDPFAPDIEDGRLYGLGSNDAGASLVSLLYTFVDLLPVADRLPVNLVLALSAEEEVTGADGMRLLLPALCERGLKPDMAIVGEPTGMNCALAERGLVVLDGVAHGKAGHAARQEGVNAMYRAIDDINAIRNFEWPNRSSVLGDIGVQITCIQAGSRHNIIPDLCTYTVDVRTTDAYTNEQTVEILRSVTPNSELNPRSTHIRASVISPGHPLVKSATALGAGCFVSPTVSDRAVLSPIPALKIGPGMSERSHTSDEFVLLSEISRAMTLYPRIITNLQL